MLRMQHMVHVLSKCTTLYMQWMQRQQLTLCKIVQGMTLAGWWRQPSSHRACKVSNRAIFLFAIPG
jgi:hypothetical protein